MLGLHISVTETDLRLPHLVVCFQVLDEVFYRLQPNLLIRFSQVPEEVEKDAVLLQNPGRPDRSGCFHWDLHHLYRHLITQPRLQSMLLQEENVSRCAATASGSTFPLLLLLVRFRQFRRCLAYYCPPQVRWWTRFLHIVLYCAGIVKLSRISIYGSHCVQTKKKQETLELQVLTVCQTMLVFLSFIFYTPEKHVLLSQNSHTHMNQTRVFLQ